MKSNVVFYSTLAIFLLCIAGISYSQLNRYIHWNDWKKKTTPLSRETIDVLCTNFELERDHRLCNGKKDVYGPDFIDIVRATFRPYEEYGIPSNETATYDEVEKK